MKYLKIFLEYFGVIVASIIVFVTQKSKYKNEKNNI